MRMDRREFLGVSTAAGLGLLTNSAFNGGRAFAETAGEGYRYRIAFDVWINDVRNQPMTLQNWPYGVLDDNTVDGIVRALDVQSAAGYNIVDLAGLWTTYGWPVDIQHVVDRDHQRRINQILKAAHERKIKVICFPSGILNWGYDQILKANPGLVTDNKHEMNPLKEESWQWIYKVFDYAASNYDIDGFHLEAADQGRCKTAECMQKWADNVAYFCSVTGKLADYLRQKYPKLLRITTVQGFGPWGTSFTEKERGYLVDLSSKVDCLFDQGHRTTYIPQSDWKEFIPKLHCAYGTSGGIWVYPPQRWERTRWFLPYAQRTGEAMKDLYAAGGRGVMYYQGPVENPSTEVNISFGGRLMTHPEKNVADVLAETLEHLYRPKNNAALRKLVTVYEAAESSYFDQWNEKRMREDPKVGLPGELHLTNLFGASPGAAQYLIDPYLDTKGRLQYKQGLISIFKQLVEIEDDFDDNGRIGRIKFGISETLVDINNIARSKNENQVWDDQQVGRQF
ncbi:MAG TPA: hypothetical protein VFE27_06560 [Acidobacteriaceae bacterium]|nr:hypothetical protein [Acidobacteriaceae bacterium]